VGASVDKAALLRRHGVEVTAQLVVLRAVSNRPHSAAAKIAEAVGSETGAVSLQTVYDALAIGTDRGIIWRVQPDLAAARSEDRVEHNHHHLICRICTRVVDGDCSVGKTSCLTAAAEDSAMRSAKPRSYWGRRPDWSRRPLSRSAGDRVPGPQQNKSETALV
jgi:Fe2+ or Zn2+ uptake regulation protein